MRTVAFLLATLLFAPSVFANPANHAALLKYYGDFLPESLHSCSACHVRAEADGADSLAAFPHNPFGDRLRELGESLDEQGKPSDIPARLKLIAEEDADQDGVSNLHELLAGAAPGNAKDTPTKTSREKLPQQLAAFKAFVQRYPWRPFETVQRPAVPTTVAEDWVRTPIDAFISTEHQARGLTPRPEAAADVLLRRVYLDLIGLSPTPAQVIAFREAFANDPLAYEQVVDDLLASPAYGERWGRHWMDVWRYSDWAGYRAQLRESQRHIWHWRDWIIESLNEDRGYDEMLQLMLAADEIAPEDTSDLRATGFLARSYFANRDQWLDNVVKHTSQGLMGVTIGCAKCHDHMYDPIPQTDYYSLRAIFEPHQIRTDRLPGDSEVAKNGIARAYDSAPGAKTYLFEAGDERRPIKDQPIPPGVPAALGGEFSPQPVELPRSAYQPDRREFIRQGLLEAAKKAVAKAKDDQGQEAAKKQLAALEAELALERLEEKEAKDSPAWKEAAVEVTSLQRIAAQAVAMTKLAAAQAKLASSEESLAAAAEITDKKAAAAAQAKAKKEVAAAKKALTAAQSALEKAEKAVAAKPSEAFTPRTQKSYAQTSTGNRTALAKWLTEDRNPLTARVAMNHIWLRHFGRPITPTVNEFGGNGRNPTHPALLDWLASELMAQNWSMKSMHRLIVTSAVYRMASTSDPKNAQVDADNIYYWRTPSRRMEGEIVRDNLLHIAGLLNPQQGGPDISYKEAQTSKRRSVYLQHAHEKLVEFVQIFDGPAVSECYMRDRSVQPHQALALANSPLSHNAAKAISAQLDSAHGAATDDFIAAAFLKVLARSPQTEEVAACREFLAETENTPAEARLRQRRNLTLVLLNHNDFVAIR